MIKINGFEKENIINFEITKKVNSHSECSFEFIISDDYEKYLGMVNKDIIINNEDDYIFCGYIDKVTAEPNTSRRGIFIKIHAFSYSKRIDLETKKRIFQNPDKDLKGIYDYIKSKSKSEIAFDGDNKNSQPILQNNETDFAFILRLAQRYGYQLFVDDCDVKNKNARLRIEKHSDNSALKLKENPEKLHYSISCDNSSKKDFARFTLNETYLNLGQIIEISGVKRYVAEIKIKLDNHNLYKYHYVLYDLESLYEFEQITEKQPVSLKAIVIDNNDTENKGRIKVKFDCDKLANALYC